MAEQPVDVSQMQKFLAEESDFDELINSLSFEPEMAIVAASNQPRLFIKAARTRVQTMRRSAQASAALDHIKSETILEIRGAVRDGAKQPTVDTVAAAVAVAVNVLAAQKAVRAAEAQEELGKLILEAYRHRRDVIKVIAESNLIEGNNPYTDQMRFEQTKGLSEKAREAIKTRRRAAAEDQPTD